MVLPMKKIPINEYLKQKNVTQTSLADDLNLTQGAIHQMTRSDREIFIEIDDKNNVVDAIEHKKLARPRSSEAA